MTDPLDIKTTKKKIAEARTFMNMQNFKRARKKLYQISIHRCAEPELKERAELLKIIVEKLK